MCATGSATEDEVHPRPGPASVGDPGTGQVDHRIDALKGPWIQQAATWIPVDLPGRTGWSTHQAPDGVATLFKPVTQRTSDEPG